MATDVAVDVSPVKICGWRAHACDCERLRLATSLKPQSAKVFSPNTRRTHLAMPIDYSKRDRLAASSDECSGDGSRSSPEGQELESDAALPPLAPAPDQETEMEKQLRPLSRGTLAPTKPRSLFMQEHPTAFACSSKGSPSLLTSGPGVLPVFLDFPCFPAVPGPGVLPRFVNFPSFPRTSRPRGTPRVPKFSRPSLVFPGISRPRVFQAFSGFPDLGMLPDFSSFFPGFPIQEVIRGFLDFPSFPSDLGLLPDFP